MNSAGFNSALPSTFLADPAAGGRSSVLFYNMLNPPGLTAGDLIVMEPGALAAISDILRFDPATQNGGVFVYSDASDGVDAPADIGFPTLLEANNHAVLEVGPENANGVSYTPVAGQPGFVTGAGGPVTYVFTSDAVPEPATIGICLVGLALILRRFRTSSPR